MVPLSPKIPDPAGAGRDGCGNFLGGSNVGGLVAICGEQMGRRVWFNVPPPEVMELEKEFKNSSFSRTIFPTRQELGWYFDVWSDFQAMYLGACLFYDDQPWFIDLCKNAKSRATSVDGIQDMRVFIEYFVLYLPIVNWQAHRFLRALQVRCRSR